MIGYQEYGNAIIYQLNQMEINLNFRISKSEIFHIQKLFDLYNLDSNHNILKCF